MGGYSPSAPPPPPPRLRYWLSQRRKKIQNCRYIFLEHEIFETIIRSRQLISRGGVEDTRLEAKAKDTTKSEVKAKDSPFEDRPSRGQEQECSRPRPRTEDTGASVLQKKRSSKKFSGDLQKKGLQNSFSGDLQNFNHSKNSAVLEPRTGQFSRT